MMLMVDGDSDVGDIVMLVTEFATKILRLFQAE